MSVEDIGDMKIIVDETVTELVNKFFNKNRDNTLLYNHDLPTVLFTKKGRSAGTCKFNPDSGIGVVNFNPIIMRDNWETFNQTVVHEVAHYCAFLKYGIRMKGRQHGTEWAAIMRMFGCSPDIYHNYDISNVLRMKESFVYVCACREISISAVRHKRILNGIVYRCGNCKCKITIK